MSAPLPKRSAAHVNGAAHADAWTLPEGLKDVVWGGDALLSEADQPPEWAVEGLLERADVAMLTGEEKRAKKTFLALELGVCMVLGASWLGFRCRSCAPRRILFYSPETGRRTLARRLKNLCAGRGVPFERVARHFYFVCDTRISLVPRDERERQQDAAQLDVQLAAVRMPDEQRRRALIGAADRIAESKVSRLGAGMFALEAVEASGPGVWGLVVIDTVRQALAGDENSSADAARFTAACRDLAASLDCPLLAIHHTAKGSRHGQRAARGSTELTAGPHVLMRVDVADDDAAHAISFDMRNHEAPPPVGFTFRSTPPEGKVLADLSPDERAALPVAFATCDAAAAGRRQAGIDDDEVLEIYRRHKHTGLSESKVRELLAAAKGGKPGAKLSPKPVKASIERLVGLGQVSKCTIVGRGKPFEGHRFGSAGGQVRATKIAADDLMSEDAAWDV